MTAGSVSGATVVLTGATSGLGRRAALDLAEGGATVAAVGRDEERGRSLVDAAAASPGAVAFHRADLADQAAVRELAGELRDRFDAIDVLAHNAGLSRSERAESPDGMELTLAVNHLAPYLLTRELLDELRAGSGPAVESSADGGSEAGAPSRVVVTASEVHRRGDLDVADLQFESGYAGMAAYARSKLANVAFALELAERLDERGDDVVANCFHPGFLPGTELWRNLPRWQGLFLRVASLVPFLGADAETGGERLVELASAPRFGERSGCYVVDGEVVEPAATARDPDVRARLWERSAELVGVEPDWP